MRALLPALGLAGLFALLTASAALEPLERLSLEARYLLAPGRRPTAPVSLVAIDEKALAAYGRMPWPRERFTALLNRLADAGVAAVGVDVAFDEPEPASDAALAAAIARVPTVLPTFWAFSDAGRREWRAVDPQPRLARAAAGLGVVQFATFDQGRVFEVEPYQEALARRVPTFATAVYGAFHGRPYRAAPSGFPWRAPSPAIIDFRVSPHAFPAISAADALARPLDPAAWKGRVALVGAVVAGLPDTNFRVAAPGNGPVAGIEVSASILENLETGFVRRLSPAAAALALLALALGPGALAFRFRLAPALRFGALAGAALAWLGAAFALFARAGIWLEVVPALGLLAGCGLAGGMLERGALRRGRRALLLRYAADMASEAERQRARLEGELHDGIQQLMIGIGRELRRLGREEAAEARNERLGRVSAYLEEATAEIKRLRADLMPPALRDGGLAAALGVLASETTARGEVAVALSDEGWEPLPLETERALYWLVKEAVNNAVKHASARTIRLVLASGRGRATVAVADDGKGFVPPDPKRVQGLEHSGLARMELRMAALGGTAKLVSAPGEGTRVTFSIEARPAPARPEAG